jgi:hypothetical protein
MEKGKSKKPLLPAALKSILQLKESASGREDGY